MKEIVDVDNVRHRAKLGGEERNLPFINARYRTQVRIVGFEPSELEDFAVPALPDADRELSPIDMEWTQATPGHEWFFSLLLEDAAAAPTRADKERLWVHLGHEDAQYLLGRGVEDPQDLRSNPRVLVKLREKLCILWGNLEEMGRKDVLSNRPFECCVLEYGVEMDEEDEEKALVPFGWKRLHRMFGTTIL